MVGDIQRALKRRQSDQNRIEDFTVKVMSICGRERTLGVGEVIIPINFNVWFIERPTMTFGGELDDGDSPAAGMFPTASAVVTEWVVEQADRLGGGYFSGCRFAAVTTGRADQRIWIHWRAEGKAIVNPTLTMGGTAL